MKINGEQLTLSHRRESSQNVERELDHSFSTLLSDSLDQAPRGIERQDAIGEVLRRSQGRADYADQFMLAYMSDLGGPLMDYTDFNAVRFTHSGEPVTEEAMKYYHEVHQMAKDGYREIYFEGKAQGMSTEQTLEKFLEFGSSLPARYKQMASIWF